MGDLALIVDGRRYGGWKQISVTRSLESLANTFEIGVTDRWVGQPRPFPIAEEDACRVELDGDVVIDGFVGRRNPSLQGSDRTVTIAGKDKAAALVECSAVLDRWTFRRKNVLEIARKLAAPFGIRVSLGPGVELPAPPRKLAVSPGETPFQVIARTALSAGVLAISDGAGGVELVRAGKGRAAPIVEGENLLAGSVDYNAEERYRRYIVSTQVAGTDTANANATRVRAEAIDENVRRTDRVLLIRPAAGLTADYARCRADWEARVRAARSETVSVTVLGWRQPDETLWPLNALVAVRSPHLGVNGDLLISQIVYAISNQGGEQTRLSLVRPDAYTPEPTARVKRAGKGSRWKELAGGV